MAIQQTRNSDAAPQLVALNGMRFFAVFHIFLYHLWSVRFEAPPQKGAFANAYANLESFPRWLNNLLAHGYLSTSFFFLLSGFILAYLYWAPDGQLATTSQRFWWQRFTRVYPVHLIALAVTILLTLPRWWFDPGAPPVPLAVASAIATATAASANQISTQRSESSGGPEMTAVTIAVRPIRTPPQPGTAVNAVARDIASRMKRMSSIACAWIGSGAPIKGFIAQRQTQGSGFRIQGVITGRAAAGPVL
jgi:hypothetical protein